MMCSRWMQQVEAGAGGEAAQPEAAAGAHLWQ